MVFTNDDGLCPVCRKPGHHFVPPSMGRFGYYTCQDGRPARRVPDRNGARAPKSAPAPSKG